MKNIYSLATVFLLLLPFVSCKKKTDIALEKNQKGLIGTYSIDAINVRQTDTLGTTKRDTTYTAQGTMQLLPGDQNSTAPYGQGFFNEATFTGGCINSDLVNYFKSADAGYGTANGWSLSWDADPDGLRIQFWGVTGGGSLHRSINIGSGSSGMEFFYIVDDRMSNTRSFFTWKIHKI